MPKNEDGEFELILGNRQVLSVFFIVVILLGVFFTVGYAVGRNSAPVVAATTTTTAQADPKLTETKPLVVNSTPETKPEPTKPIATAPQQPADETPAKSDRPKETPKETPKEVAKAEPPKQEHKAESPKAETKQSKIGGDPVAGQTYLQLSATKRAEAETYVDVLKKKGFDAMAAQVPENHELYRVLVGPLADTAINKVRTDLQAAGFPGDKAIRKKF